MKKYTFNDWWTGKVYLNTCTAVFAKGVKPFPPVTYEHFSENDVIEIKAKQKTLFDDYKNNFLKKLKDDFLEGYDKSEMKPEFLKEQILKCEGIMFGRVLNKGEISFLNLFNLSFKTKTLIEIREYIDEIIKRGKDRNFDFMNSPQFEFQEEKGIPEQVYAQVVWEQYNWLKNIVKKPKALVRNPEKNYSLTAIAIAYCVMDITISSDNADGILLKHSQHRSSNKLLQKRFNKKSNLVLTSENKSTDTKHLKALEEAKQLLSGIKMKNEIEAITLIINEFKANGSKGF